MSKPAAEIVAGLLDQILEDYYQGRARLWHQERDRLISAITWLATWFRSRGVSPTLERYQEIVEHVIRDARSNAVGPIRSPALYLHRCLQEHMRHQGDRYYEAAKTTRRLTEVSLSRLTKRQREAVDSARNAATLADIYDALKQRRKAKRRAN